MHTVDGRGGVAPHPTSHRDAPMTISDDKARLREQALARRPALHADNSEAGAQACRHFLGTIGFPFGDDVSVYLPVRDEFDVLPFAHTAHAFGHRVGMPVVVGKAKPLQFRAWTPETELVPGVMDIPVPPPESDVVTPRLLLVPLMAFDAAGYRLGYGGGYYDRTLALLRLLDPETLAVGVCYAGLEVEAVPHDGHDAPLDWIVTEKGARSFR